MINKLIKQLVNYGVDKNLITEYDRFYATNLLIDILKFDSYTEPSETQEAELCDILGGICDYAEEKGIIGSGITERDLFDTRLMGVLTPTPSEVIRSFWEKYKGSPKAATDYFYTLEQDANYIRRDRIKKDMKWVSPTEYGDLDITVNLSKPEKDPKAIAAAKLKAQVGYPKCMLCAENEGYAGLYEIYKLCWR